MEIPRSENAQNVNVTLDIINRYSNTKEQKELLGVCILFHLWRPNGVVWNVNYRNLMEWLHVGKPKAKRLLRQMRECDELFQVSGDTISARSLRDKTRKRTKKGKTYSGANCALFKSNRDYTLKEVYSIINDLLLFARIKASVRQRTAFSIKYSVPGRAYLTMRKLAEAVGMSKSSVQRITTRLKNSGVIIKDPCIIVNVLDVRHAREIKETLLQVGYKDVSFVSKKGYAFVVIPCGYAINDVDAYRSIRHKVYGYKSEYRDYTARASKSQKTA